MKADVQKKWINALRSGDYTQTIGTLQRVEGSEDYPVGFCCLGVLCDVVKEDAGLESRVLGSTVFFNEEADVLPGKVTKFAGLDNDAPDYSFDYAPSNVVWDAQGEPIMPFDERGEYVALSLVELNDEGLTFGQIADIIAWAEPAE